MIPFRIGHGYDVHRLTEGRKLIIGGVEIPHRLGLDGHSDADVLTHAVAESIIGALGQGDLGRHFPDTDPEWEGADSMRLAATVAKMVADAGWQVGNVDATVIAQAPKLAPFISQMRRRLADVFGIDLSRVSVKATTEEGLGFTGEKKGIAAHAVVLLTR